MDRSELLKLAVESPCTADWKAMKGDARVRFCGSCQQNVYNVSELKAEELEQLFCSDGRVCGRIFRRRDGTVVTRDCAWVWAQSKERARNLTKDILGVSAILVTVVAICLALVTLFGDNIRILFGGSTTGGLSGPVSPPRPPPTAAPGPMKTFGETNRY